MVTKAEIEEAIKLGKADMSIQAQKLDDVKKVCDVTTLTKLRISGSLKELPPEIGQLVNLKTLSLEHNQIVTFPKELGLLRSLKSLYAYGMKLEELPEEFGDLEALESLTLWDNKLTRVPASFGRLSRLATLDLHGNPITSLPDELGQLGALKELELQGCELTSLPADLSGMTSLMKLDLGKNKLEDFPAGVLTVPALMYLNLTGNALTALPEDLDRLAELRALSVGNYYDRRNQIDALPPALFRLSRLEKLDLSGNALTSVPRELVDMPALKRLAIEGNRIGGLSDDVARQGMRAVFQHLGYVEAAELPAPTDDEKESAKKDYEERLKSFRREARDKSHNAEKLEQILSFLAGDTDEVPALTTDDHYGFDQIWKVLDTDGGWSWVCDRVLAVMAGDAWVWKRFNNFSNKEYDQGFHEDFCRWLNAAVPREGDRDLTGDAIEKLRAFGVDNDENWARHLCDECANVMQREDGAPTSVGRAVLGLVEEHLDAMLAVVKGRTTEAALVELLMRHAPDALGDKLEGILFPEVEEGKTKHAPYDELTRLCAMDKGRYEPWVLKALEWTDCQPCKAEIARVLLEQYGDKHRADALATTRETFGHISAKKNAERSFNFPWSQGKRWSDGTDKFTTWALTTFGEELADDVEKLVSDTKVMQLGVVEVAAEKLGRRALPMVREALDMKLSGDMSKHFRRVFAMLDELDAAEAEDDVWELVEGDNLSARVQAAGYLGRQGPEVVARAAKLLASKSADARDGGARVLAARGDGDAKGALAERVDAEKSEDVRDLMVAALYDEGADLAEVRRRVTVAKKRGKLKKWPGKWLDKAKLPALKWSSGDELDEDEVRFLLYRQSRVKGVDVDAEAAAAFALVERDTAGDFALALAEGLVKNGGAVAKNRFALSTAGRLGDGRTAEALLPEALGKRRLPAVQSIALIGDDEAARALQQIADQFSTKYKNIGDAAESGFADIAIARGLSVYELSDELLDDLGFTEARDRPMKIGGGDWHLRILPSLKIGYVKPDGKLVKSAKELTKKDKDVVKALQKKVRALGKQQAAALEAYLVSRRRWSASDWRAFFAGHALMAALAQRVVWGVYEGEKLVETFLVTDVYTGDNGPDEVSCYLAREKDTVALEDKRQQIGLVHALDLKSDDQRGAALAAAEAKKLDPLFAQLERPVHAPAEDKRADKLLWDFDDKQVYCATFKRRADKLGWRRGSVIDAGEVSSYRKTFVEDEVEVFVMLEGLNVQSWFDTESRTSLRKVFFVRPGAVTVGSYTYDEPRWATDERLVPLGEVPAFAYSEAFSELLAICAE
jgi:hypothetical protein